MTLPLLTTLEDINIWINFLKTKMNGADLTEAESIIGKQYIDGRKLASLQAWGLISKTTDHVKLTPEGWDYARGNDAKKALMLGDALMRISPYRAVLEWAHFQKLDQLSAIDVGSRWVQYHKNEVETESETTLNHNAICFFHIAQGAGLGRLVIGRKGQPTRLELDREAVSVFVQGQENQVQVIIQPNEPKRDQLADAEVAAAPTKDALQNTDAPLDKLEPPRPDSVKRVFVGYSDNTKILEQVKTILAFGKFEAVIAEEEETAAIPVPDKVMEAMHRCQAAIMNVSLDETATTEDAHGQVAINDNVLIEIGAAFVLYNKNVVLLVDDRVELPSNLQGLYECRYHGDSLDFESSMKLQKALTKFME